MVQFAVWLGNVRSEPARRELHDVDEAILTARCERMERRVALWALRARELTILDAQRHGGGGRPVTGKGTVLENASQIRHPVLGLFGGADQSITPEQVQELDADLAKSGVEHTIVTYPGATHSFFDRRQ